MFTNWCSSGAGQSTRLPEWDENLEVDLFAAGARLVVDIDDEDLISMPNFCEAAGLIEKNYICSSLIRRPRQNEEELRKYRTCLFFDGLLDDEISGIVRRGGAVEIAGVCIRYLRPSRWCRCVDPLHEVFRFCPPCEASLPRPSKHELFTDITTGRNTEWPYLWGGANRRRRSKRSPIEESFFQALAPQVPEGVGFYEQHTVMGCCVDFVLIGPTRRVVIECDGHDYHERTKEQARKDRGRDRAFQQAGWLVARFTGSEIYADAERCAREALNMLGRP